MVEKIKGIAIAIAATLMGVVGMEICTLGADMAINDAKVLVEVDPIKTSTTGWGPFKRTVNTYVTGRKCVVKFDKKAGKYIPTKHQPKGYSAKSINPFV